MDKWHESLTYLLDFMINMTYIARKKNVMTNELKNARQREYRSKTNNQCTRKYEKTKSGFIMRMYRNMQSRITGIQWKKRHLYSGKELLSREDFYSFAFNYSAFH
jgi:hypothetical protein